MSSSCFEPGGSSSGRRLDVQEWYNDYQNAFLIFMVVKIKVLV